MNFFCLIGYNGFPRGCSDDALPWARTAPSSTNGKNGNSFLDTKYAYVCHAEMNAILNRNIAPLQGKYSEEKKRDSFFPYLILFFLSWWSIYNPGCRMYVALFPCNECAKLIIQSGVKDVIYVSDKYHDDEIMVASRRLFDLAGVR